jgi:hypothetical protein
MSVRSLIASAVFVGAAVGRRSVSNADFPQNELDLQGNLPWDTSHTRRIACSQRSTELRPLTNSSPLA